MAYHTVEPSSDNKMIRDTDSKLCPDWIFLEKSNVHIAKDRGWFTSYTPFISSAHITSSDGTPEQALVLGIGTVEIPTKRSHNTSGVSSHGTLILDEVLHVPASIRNIIGQPLKFIDEFTVTFISSTRSRGTIKDSQGKTVAYFEPKNRLFAIKVRYPPDELELGERTLKKDMKYELSSRWTGEDKREWQDFKIQTGMALPEPKGAFYTHEESIYLKKNHSTERDFLRKHGLFIDDNEDREIGREILQDDMRKEDDPEEDESEDVWTGEPGYDFDARHFADHIFSEGQLEWIEQYYRNSEEFLFANGLKFYDDDDLKKAKILIRSLMGEED